MKLYDEPADHAVGRSRGGLSTKIHALVDGNGRPLVLLVAPGQGGDAPMFPHLMSHLKINRAGPGRPRTRPDCVRGDKAYSSRAIRTQLRDRAITAVIPQPSDQIGHRKRRGSSGGRPPAFDKEDYKGRNVVERNFNTFKSLPSAENEVYAGRLQSARDKFFSLKIDGFCSLLLSPPG